MHNVSSSCGKGVVRKLGLLTIVGIASVATLIVCAAVTWWAIWQTPAFYSQLAEGVRDDQRAASDELLNRVTSLTGQTKESGPWQLRLSADQINGWLAVDAVENHPSLWPSEVREPRVAVTHDRIRLACQYRLGNDWIILSLDTQVYLAGENRLALRVERARAGYLPLPLNWVVDAIENAADVGGWKLHWLQSGGDPVAVVEIPAIIDDRPFVFDGLSLDDREIIAAGSIARPRAQTANSTDAGLPQAGDPVTRQR